MKRNLAFVVMLCLLAGVGTSNAATYQLTGTITRMFFHDTDFGGCMIRPSVDPSSVTSSCGSKWLTLDCNGDFGVAPGKAIASKKDAANLAYVTGQSAVFYFDNAYKHNGYCYVYRIDNKP